MTQAKWDWDSLAEHVEQERPKRIRRPRRKPARPMSYEEIAKETGWPVKEVIQLEKRAIAKLYFGALENCDPVETELVNFRLLMHLSGNQELLFAKDALLIRYVSEFLEE